MDATLRTIPNALDEALKAEAFERAGLELRDKTIEDFGDRMAEIFELRDQILANLRAGLADELGYAVPASAVSDNGELFW